MDHRLLFIKDEDCSNRELTEALRALGYCVATASEFEIAVDPGFADDFDLLVVDHAEPRINALDVCAELRHRNIEAPLVVLAARERVPDRVAAFKAGADDYLVKPVDPDELQVRIEALLARSVRSKKTEV